VAKNCSSLGVRLLISTRSSLNAIEVRPWMRSNVTNVFLPARKLGWPHDARSSPATKGTGFEAVLTPRAAPGIGARMLGSVRDGPVRGKFFGGQVIQQANGAFSAMSVSGISTPIPGVVSARFISTLGGHLQPRANELPVRWFSHLCRPVISCRWRSHTLRRNVVQTDRTVASLRDG